MDSFFQKFGYGFVAILFTLMASTIGISQPKPSFPDSPESRQIPATPTDLSYEPGNQVDNSERTLKVDSGLNLSLCVSQGNVKVNGWDRSELRVFVQDGSDIGFKILQKNTKTGFPVWVMVTAVDPKNKNAPARECISGDDIEIDLPANAVVNIKGQELTTSIESVKKVDVKTVGGDISLSHIAEGISAYAGQGDISIDQSKGAMNLESTTGNIIIFDVGPSEIGDTFKAKTNGGAISLQKISHRQVDVGSISGSVAYAGELLSGASYNLTTSIGSIRLSLPASSSFQMTATYGFGNFHSELPIKLETENLLGGPVKRIVGILADGAATLRLTTNNGSINLKKE